MSTAKRDNFYPCLVTPSHQKYWTLSNYWAFLAWFVVKSAIQRWKSVALGPLSSVGGRIMLALAFALAGLSGCRTPVRVTQSAVAVSVETRGHPISPPSAWWDDSQCQEVLERHGLAGGLRKSPRETLEQLEYLHEHGCDEIQGHWLSIPLEADACFTFIREFERSRSPAAARSKMR